MSEILDKYKDVAPLGLGTGAASALVKEGKKIFIDLVVNHLKSGIRLVRQSATHTT